MSAGLGLFAAGSVVALIAALAMSGDDESSSQAASEREPYVLPIWVPRTPGEVDQLGALACECTANAPSLDDDALARCIWAGVWPSVPYPPIPSDHATLAEAQARVFEAVGLSRRAGYCASPAPDPTPTPDPSPDPSPVPVPDIQPWINDTPWPGHLYQVRPGDTFFGDNGICARALYQATFEAGLASGMTTAKAQARAVAVAADTSNRVDYLNAIQCSPWNDALYGTWGYGSKAWPSAHGRAIRMLAYHDANYDRLFDGEAPRRLIADGKPADAGTGTGTGAGSTLELLWLPPLKASSLLDPNRTRQVDVEDMTWPDGSSTIDPPPAISDLGIDGAPGRPWGCVS